VAAGAVVFSLALGATLRVNGRLLEGVPTFYGLVAPLARLIRVPERFNVFLAMPVSVLAGYGCASLLARQPFSRRRLAWALPVVLGALILFEYLSVPAALQFASYIPSFFAEIKGEPGTFAVMNYPSRNSKDFMFEQTFHGRPILRGNISRLPVEATAFVDEHPQLGFLQDPHNLPPQDGKVGRLLSALDQEGIRYIILQKLRLRDRAAERWQRYLMVDPRYEDELFAAYPTRPEAGRDYALSELAPGLGAVQVDLSAECLNPGDVLGVAVGWGNLGLDTQGREGILDLVDDRGRARQSERLSLPKNDSPLAWGWYALPTSPSLPPGAYDVHLKLEGEDTSVPVGRIAVQQSPCNLASLPSASDVNARFGDGLTLLEYELDRDADQLDLTLYWHAAYRPKTDYKVFVHVYDPATGIPVAQNDGMPRNWTYPTSNWWPGEVVADPVSIPLAGVPAGRYRLGVGVYDPVTGERLTLVDGQGTEIEDGRLTLEETVVVE
jgi:hypothetical protein